jgi:VanZ family protein
VQRWLSLWAPPVAMMAALFVSSSSVGPPLPGRSDLVAHLVAYALLASLWIRAVAGGRWQGVTPRALGVAWIATVTFGLVDEIHQSTVAGRIAAVDDWVADAVGAALAVAVAVAAARAVARRPRSGREV